MAIETHIDGVQVTLCLRGRLSRADGSVLQQTILRLLDEGHRRLALDFSDLSEIDSAGLGKLASALVAARRRDADIRIEHASNRARDVLSKTKLS